MPGTVLLLTDDAQPRTPVLGFLLDDGDGGAATWVATQYEVPVVIDDPPANALAMVVTLLEPGDAERSVDRTTLAPAASLGEEQGVVLLLVG